MIPADEYQDDVEDEEEVEEQQEDAESEQPDALAEDKRTAVSQILLSTGLPNNTDSYFMSMNEGSTPVLSETRPPAGSTANLQQLIQEASPVLTFLKFVNEANFFELMAERANQQDNSASTWQQIVDSIFQIMNSTQFHAMRVAIYQPLQQNADNLDELIGRAKQFIISVPGVPSGVDPNDINWDALSLKIPATAVEMYCLKNPAALQQLGEEHLQIIDKIEQMCMATIDEKCTEFRSRTETVQDEFLPDATLFLEMAIQGLVDQTREQRVERMGKGMLLQYIDHLASLFATGNLPGAIQPAKIFAASDIVSAVELRASILKLAEEQIVQVSSTLPNWNVTKRNFLGTGGVGSETTTAYQQASIRLKGSIDAGLTAAKRSIGETLNPMLDQYKQITGSANTLSQQIEAATGDRMVNQTRQDSEIAKQQISLLLACLRMRCNAIQQSDWELVTEDDLDHFEIVKFLSHQSNDLMSGSDRVYRMAVVLQQSYMTGHNTQKFMGKSIPQELIDLITYTINGRAKVQLQSIPMFDADIRQGGVNFAILMKQILTSMAQKQRIQMEVRQRQARRAIASQV